MVHNKPLNHKKAYGGRGYRKVNSASHTADSLTCRLAALLTCRYRAASSSTATVYGGRTLHSAAI